MVVRKLSKKRVVHRKRKTQKAQKGGVDFSQTEMSKQHSYNELVKSINNTKKLLSSNSKLANISNTLEKLKKEDVKVSNTEEVRNLHSALKTLSQHKSKILGLFNNSKTRSAKKMKQKAINHFRTKYPQSYA